VVALPPCPCASMATSSDRPSGREGGEEPEHGCVELLRPLHVRVVGGTVDPDDLAVRHPRAARSAIAMWSLTSRAPTTARSGTEIPGRRPQVSVTGESGTGATSPVPGSVGTCAARVSPTICRHSASTCGSTSSSLRCGPATKRRNASIQPSASRSAWVRSHVASTSRAKGSAKDGSLVPAPLMTNARTTSECSSAVSMAVPAPIDRPIRTAGPASRCSTSAATSSQCRNGPVGVDDDPWPRASRATTRWLRESTPICRSHIRWSSPPPCNRTSRGPAPESR
jgi:hypothetical protein